MYLFRRIHLRRGLTAGILVLVLGGLGSSCQSTRPSYSFQPAPRTVAISAPAVAPAAAVPAAAPGLAAAASVAARAVAARPLGTVRRRAAAVAAQALGVVALGQVGNRSAGRARPALVGSPLRAQPQAGPTEAGLGTTVFGVLGLVALPVGLVGLLLGGGLAWGIVAGLGALAVLVAYLDPDSR